MYQGHKGRENPSLCPAYPLWLHRLGIALVIGGKFCQYEQGEKNMMEEIRKGLLTGFGAVLLTREKAQEATRKLVQEAKISKEEAENFVDDLFATGAQQWLEMEAIFSKTVRKGIDNLDIASKKELHGLKSKVGKLEKRIEILEKQISAEKEG
jgi:polyhydroxyalkanoate synthesis regulator phasin